MKPIEELLAECAQHKVNVSVPTHVTADGLVYIAVRLVPWQQVNVKHPTMVISYGDTFHEALENAVSDAEQGTSRDLDFAYRPPPFPVRTKSASW